MLTDSKQTREYTAQITPFGGKVNAEIIKRDKENGFYNHELNLWICVCHKSFGLPWRSSPREKDWQNAKTWVEEQLKLIEKYGTVLVTTPEFIKQYK